MLDAACPGEVFTSPVPEQMLAATKAVDGGAGVVHIVKNYTGDVMNFKLAAEDAADEGIDVESVLIDDDVAVQDSLYTAGRRGVGATVLAEKIAGAAAERGDDLATVADIARRVNERSRSFGVALSSCTPPAAGKPIFDLPDGRDGGRHRHPRRAGPPARAARHAPRELADDHGRGGARGPRARPRARGARVRQRHGRHAAARAVPALRRDRAAAARGGRSRPVRSLVGSLHHVARDGGRVADAAASSTTSSRPLWDAPVHTAALRWGA